MTQSRVNFGILQGAQPPQAQIVSMPQQSDGGLGAGFGMLAKGLNNLFGHNTNIQQANQAINQGMNQLPANVTNNPNVINQSLMNTRSSLENTASKYIGMNADSSALESFMAKSNPNLDPHTTPWCAGFVGSVLNSNGVKGTGSLAAKSYLNYGTPTLAPQKGDIAVFNDLTGKNDPNHGHVGFVQSIDQKNGTVSVLGGNQSGAVSVKSYPLDKVAGFRVAPTGQQIAQFGMLNNITPQQMAQGGNIPHGQMGLVQNNSKIVNGLPTDTMGLIQHFEGFNARPAWDVNAYRAGWGSDTTTLANGQVVKIRPSMEVSRADADRDLQRRVGEFQDTAIQQVGADNWNKLPAQAQAALTSVTYNYGSLPKNVVKAVQTGDLQKIAASVQSLQYQNRGVNRQRRLQEASLISSANL